MCSLITVIKPGEFHSPLHRIEQVVTTVLYPIIWKPIPHFEGLYEVSNHGFYRNASTKKVLKFVKNRIGYMRAELWKKGTRTRFMMHRLVAMVFVGKIPGYTKMEVNHKDGKKRNNHAFNLEWMTKSENNSHRHHNLGKNNFKSKQSFVEVEADDDLGAILAIEDL